jgi:DNA-binding transcriptional ArsR family regulator
MVHAAGGTGKTRFLLEGASRVAANGDWQVLWANTRSLEASSNWFDAVVPERPTLLCIDEPDDESLISRLQEQLGTRVGRAQQWKIAIAVRSWKDPIVRALQHPKRTQWLETLRLEPLSTSECIDMCHKLFETGKLADADKDWLDESAKTLGRRFSGYPIWISLAVHLMEEEGTLANFYDMAKALCCYYVDEALGKGTNSDELTCVFRRVALIAPLNCEDESQIEDIAKRCGVRTVDAVHSAIKRLVSAGLLRRGGERDSLVEVKPDVLRNYIVLDWL